MQSHFFFNCVTRNSCRTFNKLQYFVTDEIVKHFVICSLSKYNEPLQTAGAQVQGTRYGGLMGSN